MPFVNPREVNPIDDDTSGSHTDSSKPKPFPPSELIEKDISAKGRLEDKYRCQAWFLALPDPAKVLKSFFMRRQMHIVKFYQALLSNLSRKVKSVQLTVADFAIEKFCGPSIRYSVGDGYLDDETGQKENSVFGISKLVTTTIASLFKAFVAIPKKMYQRAINLVQLFLAPIVSPTKAVLASSKKIYNVAIGLTLAVVNSVVKKIYGMSIYDERDALNAEKYQDITNVASNLASRFQLFEITAPLSSVLNNIQEKIATVLGSFLQADYLATTLLRKPWFSSNSMKKDVKSCVQQGVDTLQVPISRDFSASETQVWPLTHFFSVWFL